LRRFIYRWPKPKKILELANPTTANAR
jgi:hypothetical protein